MENEKKSVRSKTLPASLLNPDDYKYDSSFKPWDGKDPMGVHTTSEMLQCMESFGDKVELDAKVLCLRKYADGMIRARARKISGDSFREAFNKDVGKKIKIREDHFGSGFAGSGSGLGSSLVGQDFTPLLGGPFYKNLYFYQDYIRMHADAFYAYNNDPFAKAIVQITRDFVMGTGWDVQVDTASITGKIAKAAWEAFKEANELDIQIDQACEEISIYGEVMFWELPGNQSKITYRLAQGDVAPTGIIPRVRLLDPSNLVEIVTYPEDITRPLFYVWLQPTQWQIFTTSTNPDIQAPTQPTAKFIYRQIPAEEILHFKINCVSNEKRGRSDFFPIFNYLRRLRDSVHFAMIGLEKVSAWSMDTTIEGDQTDVDAYIADQRSMGTIPPPGSEFVHSAAIKRLYLGNENASHHSSDVFEWCLSCIAAGVGIPVSYFATHLSGGTTKASALVATEPVAKKMEKRRMVMARVIKKLFALCMKRAGLPNVDCNVVFPEMISQDASQKLQNLLLCEQARWFKPERVASMAAQEMKVDGFSYAEELKDIDQQLKQIPMPLVDPSIIKPPMSMQPGQDPGKGATGAKPPQGGGLASLTSTDKAQAKKNDTNF